MPSARKDGGRAVGDLKFRKELKADPVRYEAHLLKERERKRNA